MKIALLQNNTAWKDKQKNFISTEKKIIKAKNKGASVVLLPELSFTGYCIEETKDMKEKIPGESSNFVKNMSRKYNICVIAGITEDNTNKLPYNTCIVYNKGKLISKYQKIHPFTYAKEHKYFSSGDRVTTFNLNGFKCSCVICYDLRFPEIFRSLVNKGVEIIFIIANWPYPRQEHWLTLTKARAIESQCYVAAVNRVGKEPDKKYFGYSIILDPWGNEIVSGGKDKDTIIYGQVSKKRIKEIRRFFPYLNDIRKKLYKKL